MDTSSPPAPSPLASATDNTTTKIQREFIICSWTLVASVGIIFLIACSIVHWYHPNIASILKQAEVLTFFPLDDFQPEPTETLLYLLSALSSPFLLAGGYYALKRGLDKIRDAFIPFLYSGTLVFTLVLFGAMGYWSLVGFVEPASNPFQTSPALFSMHHPPFSTYRWWYPLFLFPALLYLFHTLARVKTATVQRVGDCLVWSAAIAFSFLAASCACFGVRAFIYPAYSGDHYSAVFGSMVQVYNGAPLLVDGLRNHYGLYPHFLLPIFKITGLSVFSFNCVMGMLIVATFVFLFGAMRLLVQCRTLLFLGFACLVFFGALYGKMVISSDPYFQYYPIRTLFPAAVLFLVTLYLVKEQKYLYYPLHAICALSVLWNPETGFITFGSWITLLLYLELFCPDWKSAARHMLAHLAKALLCTIAIAGLYVCLIYTFYGHFPRLDLIFTTPVKYTALGYYAIPMPLFHPWNLLVLIYLSGLLIGMRAVMHRAFSPRSALVLFCAVLGVGTLGYYQTRSHSHSIVSIWRESLFLLPIFADMCWSRIQEEKQNLSKIPHTILCFLLLFFVLAAGFVGLDIAIQPMGTRWHAALQMETQKVSNTITENIAFIQKHTQPGEKVVIFSEHEAAYYCETKTRPALRIGLADMFFRSEWQMMLDVFHAPHPPKIFWTAPTSTRAVAQYNWVRDGVKRGEFVVRDQTPNIIFLETAP